MKTNKIIIIACSLFLMIMAFSFYLLFPDILLIKNNEDRLTPSQNNLIVSPNENTNKKLIDSENINTQLTAVNKGRKIADSPVSNVGGSNFQNKNLNKAIDKDEKKSDNQSENQFDKNIKLYQPILDDGIVRSTAKAFFLLQDAKGKLLEPKIVEKVRLWRNVRNELWIEEEVFYNHQKSIIECEGLNRQGLEPGHYSVEVDGGGYGLLKFRFNLKKNEELRTTYIMPHFCKVIMVQLVDQEGKDLEYTKSMPSYNWNPNENPFNVYDSKKSLMLINSPSLDRSRISKVIRRGTRTFGCGTSSYLYFAEKGRYFLRVFSGQPGVISYKLNDNDSLSVPFIYESKFEDNEETVYIQLNEKAILNNDTCVYLASKNSNNKDVGINTNIVLGEYIKEETFNNSNTGFIYKVKGCNYPLFLEYKIGNSFYPRLKGDGFLFQKYISPIDLKDEVSIRFSDGKALKTSWEVIQINEGEVAYKEKMLKLNEYKVNFLLSPTFFEMAKGLACIQNKNYSVDLLSSDKKLFFSSLFNPEDDLMKENLEDSKISIQSKLFIDMAPNGQFLPNGYSKRNSLFEENLSYFGDEIIKSVNHEIEISPFQNTLIIRAINDIDSGMPWVEASIVSEEDLIFSKEILKTLQESSFGGFLRGLSEETKNHLLGKVLDEEDETIKKLKKIFPNDKILNYFMTYGTWYNSMAKGISDGKGYLLIKSDGLTAGKRYSIFLWSKSQDELKPDKEISFIAQKGITDLGVIKVD